MHRKSDNGKTRARKIMILKPFWKHARTAETHLSKHIGHNQQTNPYATYLRIGKTNNNIIVVPSRITYHVHILKIKQVCPVFV